VNEVRSIGAAGADDPPPKRGAAEAESVTTHPVARQNEEVLNIPKIILTGYRLYTFRLRINLLLTTKLFLSKARKSGGRINWTATPHRYGEAWSGKWAGTPRASSDSHVDPKEFTQMKTLVASFVKNESGATAIEYGLIAAGISVAIIAVVQGLGTKLTSTFTTVKNALN
jgi:pilus assembly protein Flp/PilA